MNLRQPDYHQPSQSSIYTAQLYWMPQSHTWQPLSVCYRTLFTCGSVAEHWRLKPEVSWARLPATAGLFTFSLFCLIWCGLSTTLMRTHKRRQLTQKPYAVSVSPSTIQGLKTFSGKELVSIYGRTSSSSSSSQICQQQHQGVFPTIESVPIWENWWGNQTGIDLPMCTAESKSKVLA